MDCATAKMKARYATLPILRFENVLVKPETCRRWDELQPLGLRRELEAVATHMLLEAAWEILRLIETRTGNNMFVRLSSIVPYHLAEQCLQDDDVFTEMLRHFFPGFSWSEGNYGVTQDVEGRYFLLVPGYWWTLYPWWHVTAASLLRGVYETAFADGHVDRLVFGARPYARWPLAVRRCRLPPTSHLQLWPVAPSNAAVAAVLHDPHRLPAPQPPPHEPRVSVSLCVTSHAVAVQRAVDRVLDPRGLDFAAALLEPVIDRPGDEESAFAIARKRLQRGVLALAVSSGVLVRIVSDLPPPG